MPRGCSGQLGTAESVLGHFCLSEKCLKGHCTLVTEELILKDVKLQEKICKIIGKEVQVMIFCFIVLFNFLIS